MTELGGSSNNKINGNNVNNNSGLTKEKRTYGQQKNNDI